MYNGKTVTAVVLAAGSSNRMGLNINKVYLEAGSGLIIEYSLTAFLRHPYVDDIIMVIRAEEREYLENAVLSKRQLAKPVSLVVGGRLRSDSVYNAIKELNSDIVIIQDGARPLLKEQYITCGVEAMDEYCGAIVAIRNNEFMCIVNDNGIIFEIPAQHTLYKAQTPQCFHTKVLRKCHKTAIDKETATDDSSLLEKSGYAVKIIRGDESNIKITTPVDIEKAKKYLESIYNSAAFNP